MKLETSLPIQSSVLTSPLLTPPDPMWIYILDSHLPAHHASWSRKHWHEKRVPKVKLNTLDRLY